MFKTYLFCYCIVDIARYLNLGNLMINRNINDLTLGIRKPINFVSLVRSSLAERKGLGSSYVSL